MPFFDRFGGIEYINGIDDSDVYDIRRIDYDTLNANDVLVLVIRAKRWMCIFNFDDAARPDSLEAG